MVMGDCKGVPQPQSRRPLYTSAHKSRVNLTRGYQIGQPDPQLFGRACQEA